MALIILALCVVGFALLAAGTSRQQDLLFRRKLAVGQTRAVRFAGWVVLVAALGACVVTRGWAFGLVCYSGYTSAAAAVVYLGLIGWERRLRG